METRLKELRLKHALTQKEIGKMLNCCQQTYSKYETGLVYPPEDVQQRLAKYYDVTICYLLGQTDHPHFLE